jgi:hypothetical protein
MTSPNLTKPCARCKEIKPLTAFTPDKKFKLGVSSYCRPCRSQASMEYVARHPERVAASRKAWNVANREQVTAHHRRVTQSMKQAAFDAYGGKCVCCGVDNLVWLALDHIADDGASKRRSGEHPAGGKIYRWLRDRGYPAIFQVLCHNCNFAKAHGGCPHQEVPHEDLGGLS